ncbi:trigger factor [Mobilicoccus massiliensis]|uniref:trigger factor n=1 Tax=Mobilicoccus massiliensis TaxID=1522310 RepID=UPI00058F4C7D|nr:trigger factor [Mobilicoccus massiliensis]
MKSSVETLSPTRVKMTVEVPYEELKPSIDAAYKAIGSQISIPGFRPGKVPARIIDQRVGKGAVMQEAINEALPQLYGEAVEENDIRPMGQPEVDLTEVPMEAGDQLAFTAELDVRPTIELPEFSEIAVQVDPVAEADVDTELARRVEELQARFGTLVGVDRPAQEGDFVTIDLRGEIDGEEIDNVEGVSYEIGSRTMIEGLDDALVGMTVDEEKTFEAPLAGGDREGEDAKITVTLRSCKERELPELDDDFAQMASEFDTLDELRADLRKQAEQAQAFQQGLQARDKILEHLLETIEFEVPESVLDAEVDAHFAEGTHETEDEDHRTEVRENTLQALRTQLLLDAIAEKSEVTVSQQELIEYLIMTAQQYGMDPGQLAQAMDEGRQAGAMAAEVARRKALAAVMEEAKVTDTNGEPVDLSATIETGGDDADDTENTDDVEVVEVVEGDEVVPTDESAQDEAGDGESDKDSDEK